MIRLPLYLTLAGLLLSSGNAVAGNIYKFRDEKGNILFTNVVSARNTPQGEDFRRYTHLEKVTWYADTNVHHYGNWGGSESSVLPSFSKLRNAFDGMIANAATSYGVEKGLVKAVIHTESGFNPRALSKPGAQGLMQLMPATAARYSCDNAFDPGQNINAGTKHLSYLIGRYKKLDLALAAYNAGEKNVDKYGGIPPFAETQDYVRRVMSRYHKLYNGSSLAVN
jgi:hypothetical protein